MTRLRTHLTRALVLALLLLTLGGGIASAAPLRLTTMQSLPDDPGYGLIP